MPFRYFRTAFLAASVLGFVGSHVCCGQGAVARADTGHESVKATGVGGTVDEATKDALRSAVRQVVGAVVDSQTLISNDSLIEDSVLTYSDGFIQTYDELESPTKGADGLYRVSINAKVSRRGVVAKLRAANVKLKAIDGKGLFAEAVTQLEAENNASALLAKQFQGFPESCLALSVRDRPEIADKTEGSATVRLTVAVELNPKAYKGFVKNLTSTLDRLTKQKGEFQARYTPYGGPTTKPNRERPPLMAATDARGGFGRQITSWMPMLFERGTSHWKSGQVSVAIGMPHSPNGDRIDYKYYVLEPALESVLRGVAQRFGKVRLALMDEGGVEIVTEEFDATCDTGDAMFSNIHATLATAHLDNRFGGSSFLRPREVPSEDERIRHVSISPAFFYDADMYIGLASLQISRSMTLSLEKLKAVKEARAEIVFSHER